jgi:hypothetical protein
LEGNLIEDVHKKLKVVKTPARKLVDVAITEKARHRPHGAPARGETRDLPIPDP